MKKSVVVYIHIFFWVALIATKIISPLWFRYIPMNEFVKVSPILAFFPILFFYFGYWAIMKLRNVKHYLIPSILGIVVVYLILFFTSKKIFACAIYPLSSIFLWTTIGCLFRFFVDWFKKKNEVIMLERENLTSNLAMLKNQINPHFLFNTLHNIDTLIYQDQQKASKSLVMLSDMMRYMLKDTNSERVDLQKEIEHLENYLSLERLRLKNEKFLNYSIKGDPKGVKIAPMILIPFVENAFKHSVDTNIENGIIIKISIENGKLFFYCENQYDKSDTDKDKTHGIGLATVKNRLNLIYKNRHTLSIDTYNSLFKVYLEVETNEN